MGFLRLTLTSLLLAFVATAAQAQSFKFIAFGDMPYGPAAQSYGPYRALIERINQLAPAFSLHVGDIQSGSTPCSDEEFSAQLDHFQRFAGAVVYTPGDNEWTDCHRSNNGAYEPLERLASLRKRFYVQGISLGQKPLALQNQSAMMAAHQAYIENQRWQHQSVVFATLHVVGSNNSFEAREPSAVREFFEREAANVAWLEATFSHARQVDAQALVIAFQADIFESRTAYEDFPGWSGYRGIMANSLLPLAKAWGRPVLVIHGDSHQFRIDQPFTLDKRPLTNITRLIVPGASDVRAVRVSVEPHGRFGFELLPGQ